jgi:hypothetical protein
MTRHIVFRILAGLILLAAIAGIAFFAYQTGVTHGVAAKLQLPVTGNGEQFYPHYGIHPIMGFGFFGVLFAFFLLFLAFGAMRRLFWGPRWGWRHMGHHDPEGHGPMGRGPWGEGVPPMFAEWHRRAHASPADGQPADKKSEQ